MAIFFINKENLINNVKIIKDKINNNVKICAMVKADAYSHNAIIVTNILKYYVDYFGVASVEEGIVLRENGIKNPILCVGYFSYEDIKKASIYDIELTIFNTYSFELIKTSKLKVKVHFKIDTGMTRLGFKNLNEFKKIVREIKGNPLILVKGIFSHFVNSNDANLSENQFKKFQKFAKFVGDDVIKHISNSEGILYNNFNLDMVRAGMALYGYGSLGNLKPVLKITSIVADIHKIEKDETVGYDGEYKAERERYIATIPFGYADGMDRKYTGASIFINNKKCNIVGKICMDMFMALVDKSIKVGDEVTILFNANYFANFSNKSVYEVLSNFKNYRSKIIVE